MKFLCVQCDQAMKLREVKREQNSLSVIYECGSCLHEMAMLTNPAETQLVSSLGVEINSPNTTSGAQAASKCPFAAMLGGSSSETTGTGANGIRWTESALTRLNNIPDFIRPMVKMGIEKFASASGYGEVNDEVMTKARDVSAI